MGKPGDQGSARSVDACHGQRSKRQKRDAEPCRRQRLFCETIAPEMQDARRNGDLGQHTDDRHQHRYGKQTVGQRTPEQ
ncbi:hypothetical protein D3C80_1687160 [compost metagenome]